MYLFHQLRNTSREAYSPKTRVKINSKLSAASKRAPMESSLMDCMFKKSVVLENGKAKKIYICKCYQPGEHGNNFCNIKANTFKGIVIHLQKQHSIPLPDPIICHQHEVIMANSCAVISHYHSILRTEQQSSTIKMKVKNVLTVKIT